MSQTLKQRSPKSRGRIVAVLVVLVVLAGVVAGVLWSRDDKHAKAKAESVTLTAPGAAPARCMAPSADVLAGLEQPFRGKLSTLEGNTATFSVEHHFDDATFETVTLTAPDWGLFDLAMPLTVGATYLITSSDGMLSLCGLSGESTPELEALYTKAFDG